MNLDKCTPGQREIITTLDAPLMVAAGAGSGKTFTLTQRIVNARCAHSGERAFLDSVANVCAITFTKKAAAELRSRIKKKLVEVGLVEDALAVDSAWITTIHGAAARMLREHALEMGLDPSFQVVSEAESKDLLEQAANQIAAEMKEDPDFLVRELLDNRQLLSDGFSEGVVDQALALLARVNAMPAGFDGLVMREPDMTPSQIMRDMYLKGCEFKELSAQWEKVTKTDAGHLEKLDCALGQAQEWLDEGFSCGFMDEGFDVESFAAAFYAFPPTSEKYRSKSPDAGFFEDYRSLYACLSRQVEVGTGCREARALVRFARMVNQRYGELKGPSRLDNGDLLGLSAVMLRANPGIAQAYRSMFKLIMIDEFQDTDKLQVELIRMIAQPGLANVCVVGDAQQSIYRFRGADVNVFFGYRDALRDVNQQARLVTLPDNFRSHADVLSVVDKVFSQQCCFGDDFLRLKPHAFVGGPADHVFEDFLRINVDVVHNKKSSKGHPGVAKADAVRVSAYHVAQHFLQLKQRGARAGQMVLLLGGMGNAGVYAQALREAGFESVISGGSVFAGSNEAQLVEFLLRFAVNMRDEEALFAALTSPLFNIGDDAFVALTSERNEEGELVRHSLATGFAAFNADAQHGLRDGDAQALAFAREQLTRFARLARAGNTDRALRQLLLDSGLLDRLELQGAAGLAAAGNFSKALDLVTGFQQESLGLASTASAYAQHLRTAKESPGGLSTADADVVQIMTVHASKGLEFPHVAVAELKTGMPKDSRMLVENQGDNTYLSVRGKLPEEVSGVVKKLRSFACEDEFACGLAEAKSAAALHRALQAYVAQQTMAEAQRLLYVALTRASKSLLLCCCVSSNPEDAYAKDGIYADVHQALCWDIDSPKSVTMCQYGGSAPARVRLEYLQTPDDLKEALAQARAELGLDRNQDVRGVSDASDDGVVEGAGGGSFERSDVDSAQDDMHDAERSEFLMPVRRSLPAVTSVPHSAKHGGVWSYSSLHHDPLPWDDLDWSSAEASNDSEASATAAQEVSGTRDDDATALGSAFHVLAQRAILLRARAGGGTLSAPDEAAIAAQVKALKVTTAQEERLCRALDRWFSSDIAREVASFDQVSAEVPFMVTVGEGSQKLYLEGEIDALAHNGAGHALFVDYKTGGSAVETAAFLQEKHRLQAQCYAYALMAEGFSSVRAVFVRVEHPNPETGGDVQTVEYEFTRNDLPALQEVILASAK